MEPIGCKSCCAKETVDGGLVTGNGKLARYLLLLAPSLVVWWLVYGMLPGFSRLLTYQVFGVTQGSHLGDSLEFLFYDTPKVLLLLTLVVFGVGIIRTFFTPERTRKVLAGKRESAGNVMAALLGIVTPFCSCSAVPLFIGFVTAGVPMGVTFSFLISAPMILGLHYDLQTTNDHTNLFVENFTEINKTLLCNDLLGCDKIGRAHV